MTLSKLKRLKILEESIGKLVAVHDEDWPHRRLRHLTKINDINASIAENAIKPVVSSLMANNVRFFCALRSIEKTKSNKLSALATIESYYPPNRRQSCESDYEVLKAATASGSSRAKYAELRKANKERELATMVDLEQYCTQATSIVKLMRTMFEVEEATRQTLSPPVGVPPPTPNGASPSPRATPTKPDSAHRSPLSLARRLENRPLGAAVASPPPALVLPDPLHEALQLAGRAQAGSAPLSPASAQAQALAAAQAMALPPSQPRETTEVLASLEPGDVPMEVVANPGGGGTTSPQRRRPRLVWGMQETNCLLGMVEAFGPGSWVEMVLARDASPDVLVLDHRRTTIDLKDRWRNVCRWDTAKRAVLRWGLCYPGLFRSLCLAERFGSLQDAPAELEREDLSPVLVQNEREVRHFFEAADRTKPAILAGLDGLVSGSMPEQPRSYSSVGVQRRRAIMDKRLALLGRAAQPAAPRKPDAEEENEAEEEEEAEEKKEAEGKKARRRASEKGDAPVAAAAKRRAQERQHPSEREKQSEAIQKRKGRAVVESSSEGEELDEPKAVSSETEEPDELKDDSAADSSSSNTSSASSDAASGMDQQQAAPLPRWGKGSARSGRAGRKGAAEAAAEPEREEAANAARLLMKMERDGERGAARRKTAAAKRRGDAHE